jgi:hypothetical protein
MIAQLMRTMFENTVSTPARIASAPDCALVNVPVAAPDALVIALVD